MPFPVTAQGSSTSTTPSPALPSTMPNHRMPRPPLGLRQRPSRLSMLSEHEISEVPYSQKDEGSESPLGSYRDPVATPYSARPIETLRNTTSTLEPSTMFATSATGGSYFTTPWVASDRLNTPGATAGGSAYPRRASEWAQPSLGPYSAESSQPKGNAWLSSAVDSNMADNSASRRHSFADGRSMSTPVPPPTIVQPPVEAPPAFNASIFDSPSINTPVHNTPLNVADNVAPTQHVFSNNSGVVQNNMPPSPPYVSAPPRLSPTRQSPPRHEGHRAHRNRTPDIDPELRYNTPLYIVVFKCNRPDAFYIPHGSAVTVQNGDCVIVEADRGFDLGTVAGCGLDWDSAIALRDHLADDHIKWLTMWSELPAAQVYGGIRPPDAQVTGAVGGMGPIKPDHRPGQELHRGDLKPKAIRGIASPTDLARLHVKEAGEAKAKRVCIQKARELGYNMEILECELQL